ncbi:cysteine-rich motor neuron 1 protein-like [Asterias rubens]|uniref:cysteine-rich motor neuron 1 protein-like n=1 Tax=Asterias rubens TaxID=7604 RepID=UPI0014553185|nr:cysteine-rich motor neuron 1 protein-like [Asterias rubens]
MCVFVSRVVLVLSIAVACCWANVMTRDDTANGERDNLPCEYLGKPLLHGESIKHDCIVCTCDNYTVSCMFESCPPLNCRHTIKVEGQCCKVCLEANGERDNLPCEYLGKPLLHGESIKHDCIVCTCDNYTVSCMFESCPPLNCRHKIKVEGQCCKVCSQTPPTTVIEDIAGDEEISNETPPSTDSPPLLSILETGRAQLQLDQDRLQIEIDHLDETRIMNKQLAALISLMETQR